jgi:hypothetical protein
MRTIFMLGSGLLLVSLAACGSCEKEEEVSEAIEATEDEATAVAEEPTPQVQVPGGQQLSFAIEGGRLDGKSFEIEVADNLGYWLFDAKGKNTLIAARGGANDLDTFLNVAVPIKEPGTYEYRPGASGADSRVQVRFRDKEAGKTFALIAVEGGLTVEHAVEDYLVGTFGGKFVFSEKLGADLKKISEDDREYATIKDGRFAVSWKDRLGGKAERWDGPSAPEAKAEPATAATP